MRSRLFFLLTLVISLALVTPAFCQTEDEVVAKYLKKTEQNRERKIWFVTASGLYGKLSDDNQYNDFRSNSAIGLDGIYRSKEISVGFGLMVARNVAVGASAHYWLKLGNDATGNYIRLAEDPIDTVASTDMKSNLQVYGFTGNIDYFVMNPPDKSGILHGPALKINVDAGYYFARWELWEGFLGYNLDTEASEVVDDKFTGGAFGGSAGLAAEMPINFGGLVVEGAIRYEYLKFSKIKWYNGDDNEVVVAGNDARERVELDLSGPRVQLGVKRYFSL